MDSVRIAGISIKKEHLETQTYEILMLKALNSPMFFRKPNARKLIDAELRANGFRPSKKHIKQSKSDKPIDGGKTTKRRNTRKPKGDS